MTALLRNKETRHVAHTTVAALSPTGCHKTVTLGATARYRLTMTCRLIFGSLIAIALPSTVAAQMSDISCDDRARMTATLENVLGAERQGMGLRDPETMLEVWVARASGDWIIVQNYSNGTSCIVAMGEHWETSTPPGPA